ncbi:Similar to Ank2: Ankyrin-2 (Mus musculus) [Cotesia congregata]|uniref:Similar to Ank2: Ankyrin-2 (Mus musculus) n=1 Tax=Cotesia congregata TaxID=51543 RepID=A0A8J2MFA3_COTCN|nr:Similar to Ank2: Ankyrin-2 (Mus musculus) [Cotesia congregata]
MKRRKVSKKTSTKTKCDFLSAVFHGDKKKVLNYLKNNWDINIRTGRTSSLLYLAIKQKNFSLIELLLNNGAEINGALQTVGILEGYTGLHIASGDNDEKLVRYLISRGADVNFSAPDRGQPIHAAVYFQNINIVRILLENGADVNAKYSEKLYKKYLVGEKLSNDCYEEVNLLIRGIIKKNYGLVKLLIENGADLRECQKTVLLHAIESNSQEIVQLIINKVSSLCKKNIKLSEFINATYPSGKYSGYMCLHLACKNENPFSVSHLIQNGGNVNAIAEDGVQPIHLAILYPNVEIIKILLDNGAHIDALFKTHYYQNFPKLSEWVHSNNITLITHSIIYKNVNVVKLLLEYDVITKTSHRFIKNIIFYASASDNLEIIELILENLGKIFGKMSERIKSFVNNKYSQGCYSGYTPLHMACRNKNLSCVEFFIQNGADDFAQASDGAQAIHVAVIIPKNEEIIKLLLENGANVNAKFQFKNQRIKKSKPGAMV